MYVCPLRASRASTAPSKVCTNWTSPFPVPILTSLWAGCQVLETRLHLYFQLWAWSRVLEFNGLACISSWPEGSRFVLYTPLPAWLWRSRQMDLLAGLLSLTAFPTTGLMPKRSLWIEQLWRSSSGLKGIVSCYNLLDNFFILSCLSVSFFVRCFYKSKQKTNKQKQTLNILKCELKYRHLSAYSFYLKSTIV